MTADFDRGKINVTLTFLFFLITSAFSNVKDLYFAF